MDIEKFVKENVDKIEKIIFDSTGKVKEIILKNNNTLNYCPYQWTITNVPSTWTEPCTEWTPTTWTTCNE